MSSQKTAELPCVWCKVPTTERATALQEPGLERPFPVCRACEPKESEGADRPEEVEQRVFLYPWRKRDDSQPAKSWTE